MNLIVDGIGRFCIGCPFEHGRLAILAVQFQGPLISSERGVGVGRMRWIVDPLAQAARGRRRRIALSIGRDSGEQAPLLTKNKQKISSSNRTQWDESWWGSIPVFPGRFWRRNHLAGRRWCRTGDIWQVGRCSDRLRRWKCTSVPAPALSRAPEVRWCTTRGPSPLSLLITVKSVSSVIQWAGNEFNVPVMAS